MSGQEYQPILNPQQIAEFLGSQAEPIPDLPLRDPDTREIVKRLRRWEIFLRDEFTGRETRIVLTPEESDLIVVVNYLDLQKPFTTSQYASYNFGGVT